jgi:hypothetical protein|tara:strand:- start:60 stop:896 length:837 start_codon:yes stop_codon:yes gene_type:complete
MIKVNSISGGKTSAYIAANYKADYNIFALVRTNDKKCIYPNAKIRQIVSDKIGCEFIGTLEMDDIIHTILDLEQYIGQEITWLTGKTFDEIIQRKDKIYLPNKTQRFCTIEMKLKPIMNWWYSKVNEPVEMRIGYRANEMRRAKNMIAKLDDGMQTDKFIIGKHKDGRNKWQSISWRKPVFPLIKDNIYKDTIENYWQSKPVRFATLNNCVGCFHRSPILLKKMSETNEKQFNWFMNIETDKARFKTGLTYKQIKETKLQSEISFNDFTECDSGYCGL